MTSAEMRPHIGYRRCSVCQAVIADVYRLPNDFLDIVMRENASQPQRVRYDYRCSDHPEETR